MGTEVIHSDQRHCPNCGAILSAGARRCWLCHADVAQATAGEGRFSGPGAAERTVRSVSASGFSLASMMLFVTLIAVVFGTISIHPGIGAPLGVMLLVAWSRTAAVTRHRSQTGGTLSRAEQFQMYLTSFGLAIAMTVMVGVGVCVALAALCFGLIATSGGFGGPQENPAWTIAICAVLLILAIALVRLAMALYRYRRRHDFGVSDAVSEMDSPSRPSLGKTIGNERLAIFLTLIATGALLGLLFKWLVS